MTFEDLHKRLTDAGFRMQELRCLPHEIRKSLYYRVVRRSGNVCRTNDKLSFHATVVEHEHWTYRDGVPAKSEPYRDITFDITGEYREGAWAKLEVYAMDWDRGAEQVERIQRELLSAWDGLYGKEQT